MFGRLQNAITPKIKTQFDLSKLSHQALDNFWWTAQDLTSRPTHISELILLPPLEEGQNVAFGKGSGGVWFP